MLGRVSCALVVLVMGGGLAARAAAVTVADPGFELPALAPGQFVAHPNGSPWTFSASGAGVSHPPNGFSHTAAPQGSQVAYIQSVSSVCQSISGLVPSEKYDVTFKVTGRCTAASCQVLCPTCRGANPLRVVADGVIVETFTPNTLEQFVSHATQLVATSATETLCFVGVGVPGNDVTSFIDDVQVTEVATLNLLAPGPDAFCTPTCRFVWSPAPPALDAAKYVLEVGGMVKKDNIPAAVTSYTLTFAEQLAEGSQFWTVQACDAADECTQSPDTFTVNIDGTPPAPFGLNSPADNAWQSRSPAFNLQWAPTSDAASVTPSGLNHYDVSIDGQVRTQVPAAQASVSSNTANIYTALADGTHTWTVTALDAVGNSTTATSRTLRMDSTAPVFPAFTPVPANNSFTNDPMPTLQWQQASDPVSGVASQRVVLDTSNEFDPGAAAAFPVPMSLADGMHHWYVRATDQAGNSAITGTFAFGVDTTPPSGLQLNGAQGTPDGAITASLTPQVCWVVDQDAGSGLGGFRLYINDVLVRNNIAPANRCSTPPTGLSDGEYEWYVEAFDMVGNSGRSLQTFTFFVDTEPPAAFSLLAPADQASVVEARPTFSWTASSDAGSMMDRYEVSIDNGGGGVCPSPCTVGAAQTQFVPAHDLSVGPHQWYVTAYDRAGRSTQAGPRAFNVVATPTPTATATGTNTATASRTATATATATRTVTSTVTATATATQTPTVTPTPPPTRTATATATGTSTATHTATDTASPDPTATSTPPDTATATATATVPPSATATTTATARPTATATESPSPTRTSTAPDTPTPTPIPTISSCVGDCDGDGMVAINELILGVNIALGRRASDGCLAFANGNGVVDIGQLIRGVNNALKGCPAADDQRAGVPVGHVREGGGAG